MPFELRPRGAAGAPRGGERHGAAGVRALAIRALTRRTSQQDLRSVMTRLNWVSINRPGPGEVLPASRRRERLQRWCGLTLPGRSGLKLHEANSGIHRLVEKRPCWDEGHLSEFLYGGSSRQPGHR